MGVADSNNPANNTVLDNFFSVINDRGGPNYHNVPWLMQNVFCPNNARLKIPAVGITSHGPNFIGRAEVEALFNRLVASFRNLSLTQVPDSTGRLYSADDTPVQIGVRTLLTGSYVHPWFQKTRQDDSVSHYSKPLSDIPVFPENPQSMVIPAFAVFTFADPKNPHLVSHWSLYLDRYKMATDLTPPSDLIFEEWKKKIEKPSKPRK
jgi:hypothetical protein